jgi:beta-hydroxylase
MTTDANVPVLARLRAFRRQQTKKAGRALLHRAAHLISRDSRIGPGPVFAPSVFPWIRDYEANWLLVRRELENVLERPARLPTFHDVSPDQKRISRGENWKIFPFYVFGDPVAANLARCPETARLLTSTPDLQNAMFSILSPRYHIPPHQGPTNGIIRVHLGLIVPGGADKCRIRVGDRVFGWQEGKCVVFDDYFEHEVWNDTDQTRVVLFFDVTRPLKTRGAMVNRLMLAAMRQSGYVKDAKRNALAWDDGTGRGFDG